MVDDDVPLIATQPGAAVDEEVSIVVSRVAV